METLLNDGDGKKDLDDSGCVQDVGPLKQTDWDNRPAGLMDLSDDVLLYILHYCCPRDLKALGFTCPRLGRLIRDRTLWTKVDARSQPTGRARLRWLLAHALNSTTTELLLSGYAKEAKGCLGLVNRKRKEVEEEKAMREKVNDSKEPSASTSEPSSSGSSRGDAPVQVIQMDPLTRLQQLYAMGVVRPNNHNNGNTPNRFSGSPSWPEEIPSPSTETSGAPPPDGCAGPQFTLTQCTLRQLRAHCSLTSLALYYCNINCSATGIAHFPPTLKKLSLRGTKCYNLPLDKSFLFNIQDYLPELEYLDLSECDWLEPASLLPLSKAPRLQHLVMRDCCRLSEFVAYASLAARYGFRRLEIVDIRGCPVADSEVSAFGWLPALLELHVSPAPACAPPPRDHAHYRDDPRRCRLELEPWEVEEPDYFKIKPQVIEPMDKRPNMTVDDIEEHIEQLRDYENNICLHGIEYNLCMEGIRNNGPTKRQSVSDDTATPPKKGLCSHLPSRFMGGRPTTTNIIVVSRTPDGNLTQTTYSEAALQNGALESTDDEDEDAPRPPLKRRKRDEKARNNLDKPSCSTAKETKTSSKKTKKNSPQIEDSDSSDNDDTPVQVLAHKEVNEGASTSKNPSENKETSITNNTPNCKNPDLKSKETPSERKVYEFVRFRQNMDPVIVRRDQDEVQRENGQREQRDREIEGNNREAIPRAHVLYVNVGHQLHTVYRLSIHNEPPIFYSFAGNSHMRFRPNVGNIFFTPPTPHLDATSLVSDSAVRRFGRADFDDNIIYIGPRQRAGELGARPDRSSLRVLSITGFRNITDRSLVHLATAAPDLRLVDFSGTRVTAQGVENFKSLRPDCEVRFSEYVESKKDT